MKIAIVSTFLGQKSGGAEISSFLLAKKLNEKDDVFVVTTKIQEQLPFRAYSLNLVSKVPNSILMIGNWFIDFLMYLNLIYIFKKEKPDVVHVQDFSCLIPSLKVARKLKIPIVVSVRDFRFECNLSSCADKGKFVFNCNSNKYKSCLKKTLSARKLDKFSFFLFPFFYFQRQRLRKYSKKIDFYISVSDFVKNNLIRSNIKENKIKTINVLFPEWKLKGEKIEQNNDFVIFSAGILVKAKGFQNIIKAVAEIIKQKDVKKKIVLKIAGEGSYRNELEKLVSSLGIEKNEIFLGKLNYPQMNKAYLESDVVVQASIVPESLSRIIFESFSLKKPLIASDSGGNSELVKDGQTGLLVKDKFDYKEYVIKISKLINNKNLRKKLGDNAYQFLKNKSNDYIVKEHLLVYDFLIKNKK